MAIEDEVSRFREFVLGPEREDAERRMADRGYWGDTGDWVLRATLAVEEAISRIPVDSHTGVGDWLDRVITEAEAAHERFRQEEEDPDGYGSGTFHGCLRRMRAFRETALEETPSPTLSCFSWKHVVLPWLVGALALIAWKIWS